MKREDFLQAAANTRVKEKRLLTKAHFERLIEADNLEDALKLLQDSVYQPYLQKLERPESYEKALQQELKNSYDDMYSITPNRELVDLLASKYDYHNLKVLLKEYFLNEDFNHLLSSFTTLDVQKLRIDISNDRELTNPFMDECVKEVKENFEENKDPQMIDILCDRAYFKEMLEKAKSLNETFFLDYVKGMIDYTNVRTLLRCKLQNREYDFVEQTLIEGGDIEATEFRDYMYMDLDENSALIQHSKAQRSLQKAIRSYLDTGNLKGFEKYMDNYLIDVLKQTKQITYGPEVLFGYLMAKEYEVKNLRIILVSKLNRLSTEVIRERLRDSYV